MKMSDFESEYDLSELLKIGGAPMTNAQLEQSLDSIPEADRVQGSISNLLINAVYSYYFAKRVIPGLQTLTTSESGPFTTGLDHLIKCLVKQSVIGISSTTELGTGRTKSLPNTLAALESTLEIRQKNLPNDETQAALSLVRHICITTNIDKVPSLKYVRHLRNKWAGHASWDHSIDSWADTNGSISFPMLEDALVRMVNAFQDLGTLSPMSTDLQEIERADHHEVVNDDGSRTRPLSISWSGINSLSQVTRHSAQKAGDQFLDRLAGGTGFTTEKC